MAKSRVRRTFKDSLFRMIFSGKEELLSLYNAINHSGYTLTDEVRLPGGFELRDALGYTNPEELEIFTIEDVLYMGMKNDVSFLVDD